MSQTYFPPLDRCLAGEDRLLSWKTVYRALCDPAKVVDHAALEAFLNDEESVKCLANPLKPFSPSSQKTKDDFETKTAPINISQSRNGDYNLDELKGDAQWLSEKLSVDETTALRAVVIEWQQRAEDTLLDNVTFNEDAVVFKSDNSSLGQSLLASTTGNGSSGQCLDFSKERTRRDRQLAIHLEERSYLLLSSTILVESFALRDQSPKTGRDWMGKLAARLVEVQSSADNATTHDAFCVSCIQSVETYLQRLDDSSKWPEPLRDSDEKILLYATVKVRDSVTTLRLLLASLYLFKRVPTAQLVSSWFKFMSRVSFLQGVRPSPAIPDAEALQSLVSIISLIILRLPSVVALIKESAMQRTEGSLYPQLPDESYIRNETCIKEINLIICRAAQEGVAVASPVIFAWSIITGIIRDIARLQQDARDLQRLDHSSDDGERLTRRRSSRRESREDLAGFEKQLQILQDFELEVEIRDDPPTFLARAAAESMNVFSIVSQLCTTMTAIYCSDADQAASFVTRSTLFDLIRESVPSVAYSSEVLEALLTVLSPDVLERSTSLDHRLASRFMSDHEIYRPCILSPAVSRYPLELSPMLRLLTALAPASSGRHIDSVGPVNLLETLHYVAVVVPEHFKAYSLDHEDENTNAISLTDAFSLFMSKHTLSLYGSTVGSRKALTMGGEDTERSNVLAVPPGAAGLVIGESRPFVFQLEHQHSGLEYLGLLLSTILPNSELVAAAPIHNAFDRITAADIITLITALLRAHVHDSYHIEDAHFILGRLAYALQDGQDITTIIADILEVELLAHLDQSSSEGSMEVLIACIELFDKLIEISPQRVWSMLGSSSLLGINGGANTLAVVVGGSEITVGRFRFLSSCVTMYSHLLTDATAGLVKRKARSTKTANRFDSPMSFEDHTPDRTMTSVLSAYQTVMIDVWQNLPAWRFAVPTEKCNITTSIMHAFNKLLRSTYGIAAAPDGISNLLYPCAVALLNALAPALGNGSSAQPFLSVLQAGLDVDNEQATSQQRQALMQQTTAACQCITTLLRCARRADTKATRNSALTSHLLPGMPIFAMLLATDHTFKAPICTLMAEVVRGIHDTSTNPPSVLGQLSTEKAKAFLSVISYLDRPLYDIEVEGTVWTFLSAVMSSKQQWFAMYLLTGTVPKDRSKSGTKRDDESKKKSLLTYALEQLIKIGTLAPERAISMLKFIASAQSTWVWASNEVRSHPDFLKNTLRWLSNLQMPSRASSMAEEMILTHEHQMAAHLCDILAANIHASSEIGDTTLIKMLPAKLSFLTEHGVGVNAYKRSLHRNLAANFANKFPFCELSELKRSTANPAPLGRKFSYDLDLANEVLGHDRSWHGAGTKQQSFSDEFARANVNLSLVEAQTRLLKSWQILATTLSECAGSDAAMQGELAKTADRCLRANMEADLEQPGMGAIVQIRAEMAFVLVSKLVGVKCSEPAMKGLLQSTFSLVKASPVDYDVATRAEDLGYYRTMLQILYLAIQPHVYIVSADPRSSTRETRATDEMKIDFLDPAVAACLVQILTKVIASGFRALCGNLHNDIRLAEPGDFVLVTGLLQAILSVPGVASVHHQLVDVVFSTSIVRGALSLYSWSDQLAEFMNQDPIYGEVAIVFLLGLSTIRPVAEQMALDGVLVQLSSANLSDYFRKVGGKGPFSEPKRMFAIWTEAFLPLCLNLLDAVGPPIAAEVSTFLNSFPQQLQRANNALENRQATKQNPYAGTITLSTVSEARNLCLIALILASDTARGAAEGIDAADVPTLEFEHEKVKEGAAGLMRQRTSLASRVVPVGEREEAWMKEAGGVSGDNVLIEKVGNEVKALLELFGQQG